MKERHSGTQGRIFHEQSAGTKLLLSSKLILLVSLKVGWSKSRAFLRVPPVPCKIIHEVISGMKFTSMVICESQLLCFVCLKGEIYIQQL